MLLDIVWDILWFLVYFYESDLLYFSFPAPDITTADDMFHVNCIRKCLFFKCYYLNLIFRVFSFLVPEVTTTDGKCTIFVTTMVLDFCHTKFIAISLKPIFRAFSFSAPEVTTTDG